MRYDLSRLADGVLKRELPTIAAEDRASTATLLAYIAEFDSRKLYLPAGYPSMHAYCMGVLRMSEDAASKRIHAARKAKRFPAIFDAVAEGRLHLSGVVLLAPHLTEANSDELLAAAAGLSKKEIELLLAQRFPQAEVPTRVEAVPPPAPVLAMEHAPGHVDAVEPPSPGTAPPPAPRPRLAPLAPERFALQATLDQETHDLLCYAQGLLGHAVPSGDVTEVLKRGLRSLVQDLEKQKFAATTRPRAGWGHRTANPRHVPAAVKHAVWQRDQGQCTFVGEGGRRCSARARLEFDHIDPVARGGAATVEGLRLLCRAHNQYEAERTFGAGFMERKRQEARRYRADGSTPAAAAAAKLAASAGAKQRSPAVATDEDPHRDVVPWLRALGFRADDARRAAEYCDTLPDAPLEARVRAGVAFLAKVRFPNARRAAIGVSAAP